MAKTYDEVYQEFVGVKLPIIKEVLFDEHFKDRWRCTILTFEARLGIGVSQTKPKAFLAALSHLITAESSEIIEGPYDKEPDKVETKKEG